MRWELEQPIASHSFQRSYQTRGAHNCASHCHNVHNAHTLTHTAASSCTAASTAASTVITVHEMQEFNSAAAAATDLDQLIAAHDAYLATLLRKALLDEESEVWSGLGKVWIALSVSTSLCAVCLGANT